MLPLIPSLIQVCGSHNINPARSFIAGSIVRVKGLFSDFHLINKNNPNGSLCTVVDIAYLDLRLSVTLGKDLFKTCLEDTNVVVDDSFLLCWVVLAHDAHQSEVPVFIVNTTTFS